VVAVTQSGDALAIEVPGMGNGDRPKKPVVLPLRGRKLTAIARSPIRRQAQRTGDPQMSLHI